MSAHARPIDPAEMPRVVVLSSAPVPGCDCCDELEPGRMSVLLGIMRGGLLDPFARESIDALSTEEIRWCRDSAADSASSWRVGADAEPDRPQVLDVANAYALAAEILSDELERRDGGAR